MMTTTYCKIFTLLFFASHTLSCMYWWFQDAHLAGTDRALECTLILTEGDSAKALAIAGLEVVGRDKFGVFPLKGR